MRKTTNLEEIKNGAPFCWGEIIKMHEIGKYSIVEYKPYYSEEEILFHPYYESADTCRSTTTLEEAIFTAIAYSKCGANSQAAHFMMKMIGG